MSFTTLGKKLHRVIRDSGEGGYIDGEYVDSPSEIIIVKANIQPSMASYRTQLLPEGDRNKEAITLFSNDWLYTARSGAGVPLKADVIIYRGGMWEVVVSRPYGNFGEHCESLAIKFDDSNIPRIGGDIENIT